MWMRRTCGCSFLVGSDELFFCVDPLIPLLTPPLHHLHLQFLSSGEEVLTLVTARFLYPNLLPRNLLRVFWSECGTNSLGRYPTQNRRPRHLLRCRRLCCLLNACVPTESSSFLALRGFASGESGVLSRVVSRHGGAGAGYGQTLE